VGKLVRRCQEDSVPLARVSIATARKIDSRFDADVLKAADARESIARKRNAGGTGPRQVAEQIAALEQHAARAAEAARQTPRLHELFAQLREADL
jgi:argininosuccinate lyase